MSENIKLKSEIIIMIKNIISSELLFLNDIELYKKNIFKKSFNFFEITSVDIELDHLLVHFFHIL